MKHLKFRKALSILTALCLLGNVFVCAAAEDKQNFLNFEKLTDTADGAIYRCTAPNGQRICSFSSAHAYAF